MDNIPKELEETQLHLQVVVDPETKCITMKTHTDDIPPSLDIKSTEIIPNDPLYHPEVGETDLEKMTELEKLIYTERQRLLNLKLSKKCEAVKKMKDKDDICHSSETDSNHELTEKEKSKLQYRKFCERESSEERDYRRFRRRVFGMKDRLMQKLRYFENETYLIENTRRSIERRKQKRLEIEANETPEQRALRKSLKNSRRRLRESRRKLFRTPEEMLAEKAITSKRNKINRERMKELKNMELKEKASQEGYTVKI